MSLFVLFLSLNLAAQKEYDWWYFGRGANMHFDKDTLVSDSVVSGMNMMEGVASISHPLTGELQLYTDGATIFSRDHGPMPNGIGLSGHPSASQAALIIPIPNDKYRYYVFTIDDGFLNKGINGLRYSIVDLRLNGGKGDVLPFYREKLIRQPTAERLVATRHANKNAFWLVVQGYRSNEYYSYLVDAKGISPPVISRAGPINSSTTAVNGVDIGIMKISVQGDQLAYCLTGANKVVLMDFDNKTGRVKNAKVKSMLIPYGLEFSPDGKLLYVSALRSIYQSYTGSRFNGSSHLVHADTLFVYTALQLGKDQRIYIAPLFKPFISAIRNPNVPGAGCNFDNVAHTLPSGMDARAGLPNVVNSLIYKNKFEFENTCVNQYAKIALHNHIYYDSVWFDYGDPASGTKNYSTNMLDSHFYKTPGMYKIKALVFARINGQVFIDTLVDSIKIQDLPRVNLGNDTSLCRQPYFFLNAGFQGDDFRWHDGGTSRTRFVFNSGLYYVDVSNKCGATRDSIYVFMADTIKNALGPDTTVCVSDTFLVAAKPAQAIYTWNTGDTTRTIRITQSGKYWVTVQNACNTAVDTINITTLQFPINYFKKDTLLCKGDTAVLGNSSHATSFKWNTGDTTAHLQIWRSGLYYVKATNECGEDIDSIFAYFDELPFYPIKDTLLCTGDTIHQKIDIPYSTQFLWSTGSTDDELHITQGGEYTLTITNVCGTGEESFQVYEQTKPDFDLDENMWFCEGKKLIITPDLTSQMLEYTTVFWQGREKVNQYHAKKEGKYWVYAKNDCGEIRDTVFVKLAEPSKIDLLFEYEACEEPVVMDFSIYPWKILWNDGDTNLRKEFIDQGTYSFVLTNENGCASKEDFEVVLCDKPFYIPSAFSPNNDLLNDVFLVNKEGVRDFKMMILNQWNEVLYESTDISEGWNGNRFNTGEASPIGTYLYKIEYVETNSPAQKVIVGEVQLIR
ncbi:MAG: gliding motility-associated C-terminal domain-containing protein [Flavobacteriales bacterium]|nr:gliding motility-associated C-terminal domain-containing protein [Flavobacteriales bacterium]